MKKHSKNKVYPNDKCPCNSGYKYKKCCFPKDQGSQQPFRKLADSELPFYARITTMDGQSSSMEIHGASYIKDGVETVLIEDKITLSTNSSKGDKGPSSASIMVPVNNKELPRISTRENALVTNNNYIYNIEPLSNSKLIITSKDRRSARIKISKDRDTGVDEFDIVFEYGDPHPHITFRPDGNLNYYGKRGFGCELENTLNYNQSEKRISPTQIIIEVKDFSEKLVIDFEFNSVTKTIKLVSANFV